MYSGLDHLEFDDLALTLEEITECRSTQQVTESSEAQLDVYEDAEDNTPDNWRNLAACIGKRSLFIGEMDEPKAKKRRRELEAKRVCASCPVEEACRTDAERDPMLGVWAGENELERHDRTDESFSFMHDKLERYRDGRINV